MAGNSKTKSIEEMWEEFRDMAIAADVLTLQLRECRNIFFAGAMALLAEHGEAMAPHLDKWGDEMAAFYDQLGTPKGTPHAN